jgi:hypothetical protein
METTIHLDGYTVRVEQRGKAAWAQLDNSKTLTVFNGSRQTPLLVDDGSVIIHGTPQQLWDVGMMLARGAGVYLPEVRTVERRCETCAEWEKWRESSVLGECRSNEAAAGLATAELVRTCRNFCCNCWRDKETAQEAAATTDASIVADAAVGSKEAHL